MDEQPENYCATPLSDRTLTLRRQMLVAGLFKYVEEVRELEDGYAFRFKRCGLLTRRIADYLLFEGRHSPQLTFTFIVEPGGGPSWLLVRGPAGEKATIRSAYAFVHQIGIAGTDDEGLRRGCGSG